MIALGVLSPMRFSTAVCFILFASGCGLFGSKPTPQRVLQAQNGIGCLNTLENKVERYVKGDISPEEWSLVFNCVVEQIGFFKSYVKPSLDGGYSTKDIAALTRTFLITNREVSDRFIEQALEVKASLFGGRTDLITKAELDKFSELSMILKEETTKVLFVLRDKAKNPSPQTFEAFMEAMVSLGDQVASRMQKFAGTHAISKEVYLDFAKEILRLSGGDPNLIDKFHVFSQKLKVAIIGGEELYLEAHLWPKLIREGFAFAGAVIAYKQMDKITWTEPNEQGEFYLKLANKAEFLIGRLVEDQGGSIPLTKIDPIIDTIPWDDLDSKKRDALKTDMRMILFRTLKGKEHGFFDIRSIKSAVSFFEAGIRRMTHIEKIFLGQAETLTPYVFEKISKKYAESLKNSQERKEVLEIIALAKNYVGLFEEQGGVFNYSPEIRGLRTRNHMIHILWANQLGKYLLDVYATGEGKRAVISDIEKLCGDFYHVFIEWKLAHPKITIPDMSVKRFREGNLFMPSSDGQSFLEESEITYYIASLYSTSKLSNQIFNRIVHEWKLCPIVGVDELGQPAMQPECFRKAYFENASSFWAGFPDLVNLFSELDPYSKERLQNAMEISARKSGISDNLLGRYDIDSFSALPHYVEQIMLRFDTNEDQGVDKWELINGAYPIFKTTLADIAGKSNDRFLQAVLAYVVKFGKIPKTKMEKAHFVTWRTTRPFWKIYAMRDAFYQVIAVLSSPNTL